MQITLTWILLKSITFVTSTFSKTKACYISLLLAMDAMMLHYMLYHQIILKLFQLKTKLIELLAMNQVARLTNLDRYKCLKTDIV